MTWRECLDVLLHPHCWLQNYDLSMEWDAELNRLLDAGETFRESHPFPNVTDYMSRYERAIGPYVVWAANHPYASFTVMQGARTFRPRRATVLRCGRIPGALATEKSVFRPVRQNDEATV